MRRKKKNIPKQNKCENELSVDWDAIEGKFTETSPAALTHPSAITTEKGSLVLQPETSITVASSPIASVDAPATADIKVHAAITERLHCPDMPQITKPDIYIIQK
jgi:hypothetical protein